MSGSNPNADYNVGPDVKFPTEYRVEKFYPLYYNERRPQPQGLPNQLSYGGPYFNVSLSAQDLGGNVNAVTNTSVIVIRTGFSTHTMVRAIRWLRQDQVLKCIQNMRQRFVQLDSTYTGNPDGSATLHVSQLTPNPAVLAPGPARTYFVIKEIGT